MVNKSIYLLKIKKTIKNTKHAFHLNSKHWQNYKKTLPGFPDNLFQIAVEMFLGDASIYKKSCEAYIKFEQGYKEKAFVTHLFSVFKTYCFMEEPGTRFYDGKEKCFLFKTFSHKSFTKLYMLFYQVVDKQIPLIINTDKMGSIVARKEHVQKKIAKNLITNFLTPLGLAFWIMCDGRLQKNKKTMILHTQGFVKI